MIDIIEVIIFGVKSVVTGLSYIAKHNTIQKKFKKSLSLNCSQVVDYQDLKNKDIFYINLSDVTEKKLTKFEFIEYYNENNYIDNEFSFRENYLALKCSISNIGQQTIAIKDCNKDLIIEPNSTKDIYILFDCKSLQENEGKDYLLNSVIYFGCKKFTLKHYLRITKNMQTNCGTEYVFLGKNSKKQKI